MCGADKAEGQQWRALTEVHLPFNSLQRLDDSLVNIFLYQVLEVSIYILLIGDNSQFILLSHGAHCMFFSFQVALA